MAERFATEWIVKRIGRTRLFHGLAHTQSVVHSCVELAKLELFSVEESEALVVAAWFHDTGYLIGSQGHEHESVRIATSFVKAQGSTDEFLQVVRDLILSTRMPTAPNGLLQQILCDADMNHLGSADYPQREALLRLELEIAEGIVMSDHEWLKKNIGFFEKHRYYTEHARQKWNEQKQINLARLRRCSGL